MGLRGRSAAVRRDLVTRQTCPSRLGQGPEDVKPYTGTAYAPVAAAAPEDVTRAVDAASSAFESWAATRPSQRARIFLKAADLLEERINKGIELKASKVGGVAEQHRLA